MKGTSQSSTTTLGGAAAPLHTLRQLRRVPYYRAFAVVYTCGILALFHHHTQTLLRSTTFLSFSINLSLLFSDVVLAFMWVTNQSFRMRQVRRREFPENLGEVMDRTDFPGLDVFICTADPYKEPPISVVNTALSVMAYDYPTEKVSVYVSDDGGSELTLFAFMEAAKFAAHWLPFCRKKKVVERCPQAYFASNRPLCSETENIKIMYESMKMKVENVVESGRICDDYITQEQYHQAFKKWTDHPGFTRHDHPTVIQVLSESTKDTYISGHSMPNLIYVSREKSKASPHNFKAGALNALLRVSAAMTNAPLILTLDCDTYSNDPETLLRVLCYTFDPALQSKLAYVQFPQRFHGLNKNDIYNSEFVFLYRINPLGMDGILGPNYVGPGCFFHRRAFFGPPSSLILPEIAELSPDHVVDKPISSQPVLALAHNVAGCNYEIKTNWGSKIGFRYGSLSEDLHTGFHMKCEGWKAVFCDPDRAAFYGDSPITLIDSLNQTKRWSLGLLQVNFSKYSPITFGVRAMGLVMALTYAHNTFWPIWSIPIITYAILPQLTLLNGVSIFPKVSEPWFLLYTFLFLGAYGQHYLDFALSGGTFMRWWNDQRMWMIRCVSSFLFGGVEFMLKSLGVSTMGFNVTSKVLDDQQSKRYDQGVFEFGVPSPMFVPLVMAAIVNLFSFMWGLTQVLGGGKLDFLVQMLISGFVVLNCWPVYEAMVLRSDKGRMPRRTSIVSAGLVWAMYRATALTLGN